MEGQPAPPNPELPDEFPPLDPPLFLPLPRRDRSRQFLVGAAWSFPATGLLGMSFAHPIPGGNPAAELVNLGLALVIIQVGACVYLMILANAAALRWQTVAANFWAIGKFFLGTLSGTALALGLVLAWSLLTAR